MLAFDEHLYGVTVTITKAKIRQIVLGASGTLVVALSIIWARGLPLLYVSERGKVTWQLFLLVSAIFFFPPYYAMLGFFGLVNTETKEGEDNTRDFMSSYTYTEKSKKIYIKHFVACVVGIMNAFLMWTLNYSFR